MYLHLDPSIRNWVFFPISMITILVNLLVKYLNSFLNQDNSKIQVIKSTCEENVMNPLKAELQSRDVDIKVTHAINRSNKFCVGKM